MDWGVHYFQTNRMIPFIEGIETLLKPPAMLENNPIILRTIHSNGDFTIMFSYKKDNILD